ncbi:dihydrofolate reductase family protein [Streptomyces sp. 4N509B]|uniref:dihydrofolate reductase family protein n=1 Tax=Streptomyces sp. 4N509B TaxID=3457413 RepID=UPI003FD26779
MGKVVADISMSLDGFVTAAGRTPDEPLGKGGERLHAWAFDGDELDRELMAGWGAGAGAVVAGRRTYDDSIRWWKADGPTGPARLPVFVVTHRAPEEVPEDGVYTFVTGGVEAAVREARAAAGDRDVSVMGGADCIRQCVRAGLVDEISVHLVPVLFGGGLRLFEGLGEEHVRLETVASVRTTSAVHLRWRVLRDG